MLVPVLKEIASSFPVTGYYMDLPPLVHWARNLATLDGWPIRGENTPITGQKAYTASFEGTHYVHESSN